MIDKLPFKARAVVSDIVFWLLVLILSGVFLIFGSFLLMLIFLPVNILIAFGAMWIRESAGSLGIKFYEGGNIEKNESDLHREFEIKLNMEKAYSAERGDSYSDAAKYYRAVLDMDENNLTARFRLARIYHEKLDNQAMAQSECKALLNKLPGDHVDRPVVTAWFKKASEILKTAQKSGGA